MTTTVVLPVAGVSFVESYPRNLHRLRDLVDEQEFDAPEAIAVVLRRNPRNEFDPNAVEVHVPALGAVHGMVGHVGRKYAAMLAPHLDVGQRYVAGVRDVRIDPDHPDRPGLDISIRREGVTS